MKKVSLKAVVLSVYVAAALFTLAGFVPQAQAEGVTINYSSMWTEGEPQTDWLRQVAAEYEAESGNRINFTFVGRDVMTAVRNRILTGDAPDIVDQDGSEISAALLSAEILAESLNDLLASPGLDGEARLSDAFSAEILGLYERDGNFYFIPYTFVTSGFHYDKTLFARAGITPPKTWDEFIEAGEKFKAETGDSFIAHDGSIRFYSAYYYYWAVQRVLGAGKFFEAATDPTGAAWDNPGYLRAARMIHEISRGGGNFFQEGYEGSTFPAAQSDWALGFQGTILNGTWLPNEVINFVADDFEFGFFPFPTVEGGVGTAEDMEAYLIGWSIPKGAANADAAKDFLRFAVTRKNAEAFVGITMNMNARPDIAPPDVLADVQPFLQNARSFHLSYDGVMSNAPQWWVDVFYDMNDALFFGQITPEEFISQIKERTIDFYANRTEGSGGSIR